MSNRHVLHSYYLLLIPQNKDFQFLDCCKDKLILALSQEWPLIRPCAMSYFIIMCSCGLWYYVPIKVVHVLMFLDSVPWERSTFQCCVSVWYLRGVGRRCLAGSWHKHFFFLSLQWVMNDWHICLVWLATHAYAHTVVCRVCMSTGRIFLMLCVSCLLRLRYMHCSFFVCLRVCA